MLKTLKRKIALVAVSVLGASGLAVVAAPSANAASYATTIAFSGVRVTKADGTNRDNVPYSKATVTIPTTATGFTAAAIVAAQTFTLTSAPSVSAKISWSNVELASNAAVNFATSSADTDFTSLNEGGGTTELISTVAGNIATAGTIVFYVAADTAGTYAGTYEVADASGDKLTATWSFTTTGLPASITATAATADIVSAGSTTVKIDVKDANGNLTQIANFDNVKLTVTTNGTAADSTLTDLNFADGSHTYTFTGGGTPGSTNTVKATPQGTIAGLAAATATIT